MVQTIAWLVAGMRRSIPQLKRHKVHSTHIVNITHLGTQVGAELDTRVDKSCASANFWLRELTDQTCIVAPFSSSYEPMQDIQIVTCLAAYTDESGRTWILVFH